MAVVVLLAWIVTAGAGLLSLVGWLRRRRPGSSFPTAMVTVHVVTAVVIGGLWTTHVVTGATGWAWAAFGVLNVTNAIGDAISTGRVRTITGVRSTWWRDYARAVTAVLRGERPPAPTVHALMAGVTYFGTLVACLLTI